MNGAIFFRSLGLVFFCFHMSYLQAAEYCKPLLDGTGDYQSPSAPGTAVPVGGDSLYIGFRLAQNNWIAPVEVRVADVISRRLTVSELTGRIKASYLDVNATNNAGETLLVQACRLNCLEAVQLCCALEGFDINQPDNQGNTPLMAACEHKAAANEDLIRTLLLHGAEVNGMALRYKKGSSQFTRCWPTQTPLYLMATAGKVDLVRTMIEAGAQLGFYHGYKYLKGAKAYNKFTQVASITPAMRALLVSKAVELTPSSCCMQ